MVSTGAQKIFSSVHFFLLSAVVHLINGPERFLQETLGGGLGEGCQPKLLCLP